VKEHDKVMHTLKSKRASSHKQKNVFTSSISLAVFLLLGTSVAVNAKQSDESTDPNFYFNLANVDMTTLNYKKAIEHSNKAIEILPTFVGAYTTRGGAYEMLGDKENALKDFNKAIELAKAQHDPKIAVTYFNRGTFYCENEQWEKATDDLNEAVRLDPKNSDAYVNLNLVFKHNKQYEKALEVCNKAIQADPKNFFAYNAKATSEFDLARFDDALKDANRAIELKPDFADAYEIRGAALLNLRDFEKSAADGEKAISLKPDCAEAYYYGGSALYQLGQYEKAAQYFTKAIEIDKWHRTYAYHLRGMCYEQLGKKALASADLDKARTLGWSDHDHMFGPGYSVDASGFSRVSKDPVDENNETENLKWLNEQIALNPKDEQLRFSRGLIYLDKKQYQKSIDDYNVALEINPNDGQSFVNRGRCYDELKKHDKAIEDYTAAIRVNPKLFQAYYNRGYAYVNQAKYQKALEDLTLAIKINPSWLHAYENRCICYYMLQQYGKAIAESNKVLEFDPKSGFAYLYRGKSCAQTQKDKEAFEDLSKAISMHLSKDNLIDAYDFRGKLYDIVGKHDLAEKDAAMAAKLEKGSK
jgi:tetratricopeptide (TPR) repeat protein